MRKSAFALMATVGAIFFTGCASKLETAAIPNQKDGSTLITAAPSYSAFNINPAGRLNDTIIYTLQVAAEKTLESGKTHFAIVSPDEISNTKGIMVNSAKEFSDKCANNNFAKAFVVLTNPCKIAVGPLEGPLGGKMTIMMYDDKDKPSEFLTYDANSVIAELKKMSMYRESSK